MALAKEFEQRFEQRTIIGPIDKTLEDFNRNSLPGSSITITGENSAEVTMVVDSSYILEKKTSETARKAKRKISQAIRNGLTSFPVVRTLKRAQQH